MWTRGQRRTLSFGLQTVLGLRQKGFFIPLRTAPAAALWSQTPSEALAARFEMARPTFAAHLEAIGTHAADLAVLNGPPPEPRFDQTWFPRLDAAALYTLVRTAAPRRIVEVGSGHSTRFLARAVRDGGLSTAITAIDPMPRADLAGLPIDLRRQTLQEAGLEAVSHLTAGDLLFVDSSHVLMPGTDVDIVLSHIIPALPAGVLVGFHDIFLPDPYPPAWPFSAYNEQNAVAPLLPGATLVFSSHYVVTRMADALAAAWPGAPPLKAGARESLLLIKL
ncbi:MAG: class I SAM-dependent methyltransferase [Pseudomonadota bacterium]